MGFVLVMLCGLGGTCEISFGELCYYIEFSHVRWIWDIFLEHHLMCSGYSAGVMVLGVLLGHGTRDGLRDMHGRVQVGSWSIETVFIW
jgi:hypothetical protein